MQRVNGHRLLNEKETRKKLLESGKAWGFEGDLLKIFDKYDKLLKSCSNPQEREAIAIMGAQEINKLLGAADAIEVNGKVIK